MEVETEEPMLERSHICTHINEQRLITGTWCTPELQKAEQKGHQIVHIYEVWHFLETSDGLFQD